jgi:hypothetical protein
MATIIQIKPVKAKAWMAVDVVSEEIACFQFLDIISLMIPKKGTKIKQENQMTTADINNVSGK